MASEEKKQEFEGRYLVLGATGFTGKHVLSQLLDDPDCKSLLAITRRELPEHPKQQTLVLKDVIDDLDTVKDKLENISAVICCTGIPSGMSENEAQYVRVEYEMPMAVARAVHEKSPNAHFVFCSGNSVSEDSKVLFARTKARTEKDLTTVGFPRVTIVRPGGILDNNQKHRYWAYNLSKWFEWMLPDRIFIQASDVARTMILVSKHPNETLGVPDHQISTDTCVAPIYQSVTMKGLLKQYTSNQEVKE